MIEARAAELLAQARTNPAITINDEAKARGDCLSRASAEAERME